MSSMTLWRKRGGRLVDRRRYVEFHEEQTGPLTPGKWADITALSRDIMTVPADSVLGIEVLYTIVDGKVVYSADAAK